MMSWVGLRRVESMCFGVQWLLVGCVVWLILDSWFFRSVLPKPDLIGADAVPAEVPSARMRTTVNQLQGIWMRDLRQRLIEPKAEKKPTPKAPPPPPPAQLPRLTATFVERGQAWGLFRERRGTQRVLTASETIDDFQVFHITPGTATLTRNGQSYTVKVDQPEWGPRAHRASSNGQ